ncbi:MAG: helix-turn-helix transcriptional regulator [Clostridia bacterium]|nr:helix-turn-helix transcriptional regulator [Clostridia bacterium]
MKKIILENIERNISFTNIYGLNQTWVEYKKWSCMGDPRASHGFMYIFNATVSITCKNSSKPQVFHKGDLLYIPKNSEYVIEFQDVKGTITNVLINFDICDTDGSDYCIEDEIKCIAKNIPTKITDSMLTISHLSTNLANPTVPVTKAFYEMIDKLINHLLAIRLHATEKDSVLPAIIYMDSHILDDVPVPQLAQMCLLNESAFRKAFKAHTGMNPVQYKMMVKINKAKMLLSGAAEIPIETVAESLGFYDNAYFHKVFVKCTGQTPKQYRDSFS